MPAYSVVLQAFAGSVCHGCSATRDRLAIMPAVAQTDAARLDTLLGQTTIWRPIEVVDQTGSTNADLMKRIAQGAEQGLVRIAEHQTAGQGRFDRVWTDVPGASVAVSAVVQPSRPVTTWGWLSLVTGMAVVDGLRDATGADACRIGLKWPNDVQVDGLKVCGVLAQTDGRRAVLGWGLNVGASRDELPVATATSLAVAGLLVDKTLVVAAVLAALQRHYLTWDGGADLRASYLEVSSTMGRQVRVMQENGACDGMAVGIDDDGALLVDIKGRGVVGFTAGDVVHLR